MSDDALKMLELTIRSRLAAADADSSYTAQLAQAGVSRIAQKVGEEGVEVALATVTGSDEALIGESADLLYHLLVALNFRGLSVDAVYAELANRHTPTD